MFTQNTVCLLTATAHRFLEATLSADREVFGEDMPVLLCTWHVKRNWLKHLHRKVRILAAVG